MVTDLVSKCKELPLSHILRFRAREKRSWLCVGLDPDLDSLPAGVDRTVEGAVKFCTSIVDATYDLSVAFKINFAYFESLGPDGFAAIKRVRETIPSDVPVIADAKRGDIGNTSRHYARAIFESLGFDAVTISPYVGWDSVKAFTTYSHTAVFVLCKTSNPAASDLQDLDVGGEPLYMHVAQRVLQLQAAAEVGVVVGATQPEALEQVRALDPNLLILVPGVGAQGARADDAARVGANSQGDNAIVAVSRSILYASKDQDYVDAARVAASQAARLTWAGHAAG